MFTYYGELQSDIVEELFEDGGIGDPSTEGTNRTGTYYVLFLKTVQHLGCLDNWKEA